MASALACGRKAIDATITRTHFFAPASPHQSFFNKKRGKVLRRIVVQVKAVETSH